jgi:hypothetical protein
MDRESLGVSRTIKPPLGGEAIQPVFDGGGALLLLQRVAPPRIINALMPEERVLAVTRSSEGVAFRRLLSDRTIESAFIAALTSEERKRLMARQGRTFKKFLQRFSAFCRKYQVGLSQVPPTLLAEALCHETERGAHARVRILQRYGALPSVPPETIALVGMALCQTDAGARARSRIADVRDRCEQGPEKDQAERFLDGTIREELLPMPVALDEECNPASQPRTRSFLRNGILVLTRLLPEAQRELVTAFFEGDSTPEAGELVGKLNEVACINADANRELARVSRHEVSSASLARRAPIYGLGMAGALRETGAKSRKRLVQAGIVNDAFPSTLGLAPGELEDQILSHDPD